MNGLFRIDAVRDISGLQLQLNDGFINRYENEFAVRTRNKMYTGTRNEKQ